MDGHEIMDIPLENLIVNDENFRFDPVDNQREAIRIMIEKQGYKLYNLAEDIVEAGLNPSDLPSVVKVSEDRNLYKIMEGNRRIIALKLLSTPSLLNLAPKSMKSKMEKLVDTFEADSYKIVKCVAFDNEDDAYRWIRLKHTGENLGRGTVKWDASSIQRFHEKMGRPSIALQATDFVKKVTDDEDLKKKVGKISITNLDRLLRDPEVRDAIGIKIQEEELVTDLVDTEVKKGLIKITRDLAENKIKVRDIYTKKNREIYIDSFSKKDFPDKTKITESPWKLATYDKKYRPKQSKKKRKPKSTSRKCVIPKNCVMGIEPPRINDIYIELRNINVNNYPNAVAVMLRVFLELSLDQFIKTVKIGGVKENDRLYKKLQKVSDYLEDNNILTKNQLKPIRGAASQEGCLQSTCTLNAYVHNMDFSPIPNELKTTWDRYQVFIETLWDEIEKNK